MPTMLVLVGMPDGRPEKSEPREPLVAGVNRWKRDLVT